jgi:hypothetical protein
MCNHILYAVLTLGVCSLWVASPLLNQESARDPSTDVRTAEVVGGRVAFALGIMCKDDERDSISRDTAGLDDKPAADAADAEAAWTQVPPAESETECEVPIPQTSRMEELATPKTARSQPRPSTVESRRPRTAVRGAKGAPSSRRSSASPPPFVGMVSSVSAAAASSAAASLPQPTLFQHFVKSIVI